MGIEKQGKENPVKEDIKKGILNLLDGLDYKEARKILSELLEDIKDRSTISVLDDQGELNEVRAYYQPGTSERIIELQKKGGRMIEGDFIPD